MLTIIVISALILIAGLADGIRDALYFRYYRTIFAGRNDQFWKPELSWRNKYRDGDPLKGPRFPFSTTALVFLTDGWHLMQFIHLTAYQLAAGLLVWQIMDWHWWTILGGMVAAKLIFSGAFHATFNYLILRRDERKI